MKKEKESDSVCVSMCEYVRVCVCYCTHASSKQLLFVSCVMTLSDTQNSNLDSSAKFTKRTVTKV